MERKNAPYAYGEENFEKLPDDLILHIMSFMDTKSAVQTCVLSKRWIHIWKSLRFLSFSRWRFAEDKGDSFVMFVDLVLLCRDDTEIDTLSLDLRRRSSAYDHSVLLNVKRWSLSAVMHNVKKFHLLLSSCPSSAFEIPQRLLNCKSLEQLVVEVFNPCHFLDIVLPKTMHLPELKELGFTGVSISNAESTKKLFAGCPVLELLKVSDSDIQTDGGKKLVIECVCLKKFVYTCWCKRLLAQTESAPNLIELHAPNLDEFTCFTYLKQNSLLEVRSPLSNAWFFSRLDGRLKEETADTYSKLPLKELDEYAKRVIKFLSAVSMVRKMRLSPGFLEVLSRAHYLTNCQLPKLSKLKHLVLDLWSTKACFRAVALLLKIAPHITELYLTYEEENLPYVGDWWDNDWSLQLSHLKAVEVRDLQGCSNELSFLRFLLANAVFLNKLVLHPRSSVVDAEYVKDFFLDNLSALPRASSRLIEMQWPATKDTYLI